MSEGRIRLARVVTRLNIGGPARHVRLLHERLDSHLFEEKLFIGETDTREGNLEFGDDPESVERVPGLKRKLDPLQDLGVFRHLLSRLRQLSPGIVHTHMAKAGALGRFAGWRAGVPVIAHTFHGHVLEGYFTKFLNEAFVTTERALARRTDALIAVSTAVRDELLALGIGRPEQWHVVPLGLDLREIRERSLSREEARTSLGLSTKGPAVGIVGRLVPIKDHKTFFQAAAQVVRSCPDATFVVAGDGALRAELEEQAHQLDPGKVKFLGWISDLPALYGALDVVVLTSRNEGTPVALIEAGAASRPVVATDVGGVREVVQDGKTGLLAKPGDALTVASHIVTLLNNGAVARAMGAAGHVWVRERFSADRLLIELTALYEELLAAKGLVKGSG